MLLEKKNAVIYGGGGAIGSAVARVFAREKPAPHLVDALRLSTLRYKCNLLLSR